MTEIQKQLFSLADVKYREFTAALTPSVEKELIIGIRTPVLRAFAKEMDMESAIKFMSQLPHKYYEENNLHAFLIERIQNFDECIAALDEFLPFIDNWATCDMMSPKVFKNNKDRLIPHIKRWISSKQIYAIRYAIVKLMSLYLDEDFKEEYMLLVASAQCDEYYINMAIAWYFATALAKQYDSALRIIKEGRLNTWTHNKAIQKARESKRVSAEQKEYLRILKIKPAANACYP